MFHLVESNKLNLQITATFQKVLYCTNNGCAAIDELFFSGYTVDTFFNFKSQFLKHFLDGSALSDVQPTLQIIEVIEGQNHLRVQLSDGLFSYSECVVTPLIAQRFQADGLSTKKSIIKVTNWEKEHTRFVKRINFI